VIFAIVSVVAVAVGAVTSATVELFVIELFKVWLTALFSATAASFTELPTLFAAV